jgi:hypothetical protein
MARTFVDVSIVGLKTFRVYEDDNYKSPTYIHLTREQLQHILLLELDDEFEATNENIELTMEKHPAYNEYKAERELRKDFYISHICKMMVSPDYVRGKPRSPGAFDYNALYMRMGEQSVRGEETFGFLLANPLPGNGIYVDVICSKKSKGKDLIQFFIQFAEQQEYEFIELSSLVHVLAYYPKMFQFAHRKSCSSLPEVTMPEPLQKALGTLMRDDDKVFELIEKPDLIHDDKFFPFAGMLNHFLFELAQKGYLAPTSKKCGEEYNTMTMGDLISNGCFENGLKMRKCLNDTATVAEPIPAMSRHNRTAKKAAMIRKTAKAKTHIKQTLDHHVRSNTVRIPRRSKRLAKRPAPTWTRIQRPVFPKRARTRRN